MNDKLRKGQQASGKRLAESETAKIPGRCSGTQSKACERDTYAMDICAFRSLPGQPGSVDSSPMNTG
jgi:hypothetical protein